MSGFRDSFTKEDTKEDILGYDDTAFCYFVISVLTCVAIPWTLLECKKLTSNSLVERRFPTRSNEGSTLRYCRTSVTVRNMDMSKREMQRWTSQRIFMRILQLASLAVVWAGIIATGSQLGFEKEIAQFDPFLILDIGTDATGTQIRKAYRKLSLLYHPDKNPDDPWAASRFIQITRAFQTLTDSVARANWEKFGNPDGTQSSKVGIGLPMFLLEKSNKLMILIIFFSLLIIVVPMTFICYFQQAKNFASNGVMIESLQFLGCWVTESTRVNNCPEMLAACAECRQIALRQTDDAHIKRLDCVVEHRRPVFIQPVVVKNQLLIWAHMQRYQSLMTRELREDTEYMLRHAMCLTQAMIEIACMKEWFACAQAVLEFRRCLLQSLDVRGSPLLQAPHFTAHDVERCRALTPPVVKLQDFLTKTSAQRRLLLADFDADQMADVEAFCSHLGSVTIQARIDVEDENECVVGDVATVSVRMVRTGLREGEAQGPVHAPLFPEPHFEEWWLFLVEATEARIIHFERVVSLERVLEEQLRIQIVHPGENNFVLHAICDSYVGLDQKVELKIHAFMEEECPREYPLHEADEDLDLQPTLFQQWLGEFADDSEEEEGTCQARRRAQKVRGRATDEKGQRWCDDGQMHHCVPGARNVEHGDTNVEEEEDSSSESSTR